MPQRKEEEPYYRSDKKSKRNQQKYHKNKLIRQSRTTKCHAFLALPAEDFAFASVSVFLSRFFKLSILDFKTAA